MEYRLEIGPGENAEPPNAEPAVFRGELERVVFAAVDFQPWEDEWKLELISTIGQACQDLLSRNDGIGQAEYRDMDHANNYTVTITEVA